LFWSSAFVMKLKVTASKNLLWPNDSVFLIIWDQSWFRVWSTFGHFVFIRSVPHVGHIGGIFLLIRWLWVICVCSICSLVKITSNFLGRYVPRGIGMWPYEHISFYFVESRAHGIPVFLPNQYIINIYNGTIWCLTIIIYIYNSLNM